jgi:thiamine-phosphate pyrophosphorylase
VVRTTRRILTDLGRKLNLVLGPARPGGRDLPGAYAMTDSDRGVSPAELLAGLPQGGALILRHRDTGALAAMAAEIMAPARRQGVLVLVAGDARLALRLGADGVHLPEALLRRRPGLARFRPKPGWVATASAHGATALRRARTAGADAVLLSPVLATPSHPAARPLGRLRFARLCRAAGVAVVALGGIDPGTILRLKGSGLAGVAGIGLFSTR